MGEEKKKRRKCPSCLSSRINEDKREEKRRGREGEREKKREG